MSILGFSFPLLISVFIAFTNVIPVFGPFLGAIPSILILLMINPMQAVWFTVFIIVLQQLDGNFIGPKVVGDSIGLPALWTILSIFVGGGLFGVFGMLIGVPTFAVIYALFKKATLKRLVVKDIK
jgi:predicted PurR-regulated permease PerM